MTAKFMESNNMPETYKGYKTKDLLKVWEEIKAPGGTKAPEEMITAMGSMLRELRLGKFSIRNPKS